jgi:hypothetical protein
VFEDWYMILVLLWVFRAAASVLLTHRGAMTWVRLKLKTGIVPAVFFWLFLFTNVISFTTEHTLYGSYIGTCAAAMALFGIFCCAQRGQERKSLTPNHQNLPWKDRVLGRYPKDILTREQPLLTDYLLALRSRSDHLSGYKVARVF